MKPSAAHFPFDPSELRNRIKLWGPSSDDPETWQGALAEGLIATVWAGVQTSSARQRVAAEQLDNEHSLTFVIRYRTDALLATRLEFDGRSLDITAKHDPDLRKTWLVLETRSPLGDGS